MSNELSKIETDDGTGSTLEYNAETAYWELRDKDGLMLDAERIPGFITGLDTGNARVAHHAMLLAESRQLEGENVPVTDARFDADEHYSRGYDDAVKHCKTQLAKNLFGL